MRFLNHEKGTIGRKHSLMRYDVHIPGRPFPWDGVGCLNPQHFERGEVVTIGFIGKKRQLPVILNQKPWPMSHREEDVEAPVFAWSTCRRNPERHSWIEGELLPTGWTVSEIFANPAIKRTSPTALLLSSGTVLRRDDDEEELPRTIEQMIVLGEKIFALTADYGQESGNYYRLESWDSELSSLSSTVLPPQYWVEADDTGGGPGEG